MVEAEEGEVVKEEVVQPTQGVVMGYTFDDKPATANIHVNFVGCLFTFVIVFVNQLQYLYHQQRNFNNILR